MEATRVVLNAFVAARCQIKEDSMCGILRVLHDLGVVLEKFCNCTVYSLIFRFLREVALVGLDDVCDFVCLDGHVDCVIEDGVSALSRFGISYNVGFVSDVLSVMYRCYVSNAGTVGLSICVFRSFFDASIHHARASVFLDFRRLYIDDMVPVEMDYVTYRFVVRAMYPPTVIPDFVDVVAVAFRGVGLDISRVRTLYSAFAMSLCYSDDMSYRVLVDQYVESKEDLDAARLALRDMRVSETRGIDAVRSRKMTNMSHYAKLRDVYTNLRWAYDVVEASSSVLDGDQIVSMCSALRQCISRFSGVCFPLVGRFEYPGPRFCLIENKENPFRIVTTQMDKASYAELAKTFYFPIK
jgi:hypothetical protein